MGSLIDQIRWRKENMQLTWEDIARSVHKDVSTVKKQLSQSGNPSLSTLEEYTKVLGGRLVFLSDDIPVPKNGKIDQDYEIERLREILAEKDKEINDYRISIQRLREQYDRLSQLVVLKDAKVERLNERIYELSTMLVEK